MDVSYDQLESPAVQSVKEAKDRAVELTAVDAPQVNAFLEDAKVRVKDLCDSRKERNKAYQTLEDAIDNLYAKHGGIIGGASGDMSTLRDRARDVQELMDEVAGDMNTLRENPEFKDAVEKLAKAARDYRDKKLEKNEGQSKMGQKRLKGAEDLLEFAEMIFPEQPQAQLDKIEELSQYREEYHHG